MKIYAFQVGPIEYGHFYSRSLGWLFQPFKGKPRISVLAGADVSEGYVIPTFRAAEMRF